MLFVYAIVVWVAWPKDPARDTEFQLWKVIAAFFFFFVCAHSYPTVPPCPPSCLLVRIQVRMYVCVCICACVCVCVLLLKVHIHPVRPSGGQPLAKCTTERLLCDWSEAASAPLGETLKNASVKKNPISPCNIKSSLSSCSDATESITGSLNDVCRGWAKSTGQNSGRLFCGWLFFFFFSPASLF